MKFASQVKESFNNLIHDLAMESSKYVRAPDKDFTRNRKLNFETTIHLLLSLSNKSSQDELLTFFDHHADTPSVSALIQQRDKLLPNLFPELLHRLNNSYPGNRKFKGYRLLACDGSDINIFRNPDDSSTYYHNSENDKGFNELHIDALYDLCNRVYKKINIDGRHDQNEQRAMVNFMSEYSAEDRCVFIADRNYASYNIIAHALDRRLDFLIRTKDFPSKTSILSNFNIDPNIGEFDLQFSLKLVRSKKSIDKNNPDEYKLLSSSSTFDFIETGQMGVFPITFRVVRFLIDESRYEAILTSLNEKEFPANAIKELYAMRWGIETSFRELKHTLALNKFHSKKVGHIHQEIYVANSSWKN